MKSRLFLIASLLTGVVAGGAWASGSYSYRPPRPPKAEAQQPAGKAKIDKDKYHLGQQVFTGKAKIAAADVASATEQAATLIDLQKALPERALGKGKKRVDLPSLAGRLSPGQLESLQYYLKHRYGVDLVEWRRSGGSTSAPR